MTLNDKIEVLENLSKEILNGENETWARACREAEIENPWFTQNNITKAYTGICENYFDGNKIRNWIGKYRLSNVNSKKNIAMVLAGNIPLVGMHDIVCNFLCDNISKIKMSSKDEKLLPAIFLILENLNTATKEYFEIVERLENFDAVIATGSNNSARYFDHYFGKYPNLIRKNRNGVAVMDNSISDEEIKAFGEDVFNYFGLGCRNVSKLYIPENFDITKIFEVWGSDYDELVLHNKYKNNFDYNYSIYLLNQDKFLSNNIIIFKEDKEISSRIACLNYEYYKSMEELEIELESKKDQIQCLVSNTPIASFKHFDFGSAQSPSLEDYADGIDTIQFLLGV